MNVHPSYILPGPLAALATFLPCYLFTVIPAPHFKRIAGNVSIKAFGRISFENGHSLNHQI